MKKIFTIISLAFISIMSSAQGEKHEFFKELDVLKKTFNRPASANCVSWSVEMDYPAATLTGAGGLAGVTLVDSVFWISQWNSANLYIIDTAGNFLNQFTINGLTGTRSLSYDGQYVYAGAATNDVYKIDPTTLQLVSTISSPVPARHCAYDSSANAGAGGFWVGNWNTDIVLIDTAGNQLNAISAGTHGMTAMYGSTVDHISPGGPFLWVFDQSQDESSAVIVQIDINSGSLTGVTHDVAADVGFGQANPLAGGMFMSNTLQGGKTLVCGLLQGDGNIFGYELDTTSFVDLTLDRAYLTEGYGDIPERNISGVSTSISVDFKNNSCTDSILESMLFIDVEFLNAMVYSDSILISNIASPSSSTYDFIAYQASDIGEYTVRAYLSHNYTEDLNRANDTIVFTYRITDSIYSRDNGVVAGSLGIGDDDDGVIAQLYNAVVDQGVNSVDVLLRSPTDGDTLKIEIYEFVDGTGPTNLIYSSPAETVQGDTAQWINFPIKQNLFTGKYLIGVREFGSNITVATNEDFYVPGVSYFYLDSQGSWFQSENNGFEVSYFIRPNVGDLIIDENTSIKDNQDVFIKLIPNPAKEFVLINSSGVIKSIVIYNNQGKEVLVNNNIFNSTSNISLSGLSQGMYQVVVTNKDESKVVRKLSLIK